MSEQEFENKIAIAIAGIEKAKSWFWKAALVMLGTSIAMIATMAVSTSKIAEHDKLFDKAASRQGVIQLVDIHQAEVKAITNLVENPDSKKAIEEIQKMIDRVNGNIFMYSLPVTRGGYVENID